MRRAAARSQCASNLRQIAIGLQDYADAHPGKSALNAKGSLLPAGTVPNAALPPERRLSWLVEILPFVEQDALSRRIDRQTAWDAPANMPAVVLSP